MYVCKMSSIMLRGLVFLCASSVDLAVAGLASPMPAGAEKVLCNQIRVSSMYANIYCPQGQRRFSATKIEYQACMQSITGHKHKYITVYKLNIRPVKCKDLFQALPCNALKMPKKD